MGSVTLTGWRAATATAGGPGTPGLGRSRWPSRSCGKAVLPRSGERLLEGAYPYLWLDAKVEKVRAGGRVQHRALVVSDRVDQAGQREVIGPDVGAAETEAFWREFLRSLVRRGLAGCS